MRLPWQLLILALFLFALGCTTTPAGNTDSLAQFGPVRERVLPLSVPCAMYLFQFGNGEIFVSGHGPGTTPEQAAQDLKKISDAGGVDLCAEGGKAGFQLVGEECLFASDPNGLSWDKLTPKQVLAKMKAVEFAQPARVGTRRDPFDPATGGGFGVTHLAAGDLPVVYLFKTAQGDLGVLEILTIVEDQRGYSGDGKGWGMAFRYKMVQQPK